MLFLLCLGFSCGVGGLVVYSKQSYSTNVFMCKWSCYCQHFLLAPDIITGYNMKGASSKMKVNMYCTLTSKSQNVLIRILELILLCLVLQEQKIWYVILRKLLDNLAFSLIWQRVYYCSPWDGYAAVVCYCIWKNTLTSWRKYSVVTKMITGIREKTC